MAVLEHILRQSYRPFFRHQAILADDVGLLENSPRRGDPLRHY